jgi:hypothetical protein
MHKHEAVPPTPQKARNHETLPPPLELAPTIKQGVSSLNFLRPVGCDSAVTLRRPTEGTHPTGLPISASPPTQYIARKPVPVSETHPDPLLDQLERLRPLRSGKLQPSSFAPAPSILSPRAVLVPRQTPQTSLPRFSQQHGCVGPDATHHWYTSWSSWTLAAALFRARSYPHNQPIVIDDDDSDVETLRKQLSIRSNVVYMPASACCHPTNGIGSTTGPIEQTSKSKRKQCQQPLTSGTDAQDHARRALPRPSRSGCTG